MSFSYHHFFTSQLISHYTSRVCIDYTTFKKRYIFHVRRIDFHFPASTKGNGTAEEGDGAWGTTRNEARLKVY